ncbi:MAG: hypothetical protein J6R04_03710 [Clostridia bacterium]|nr:hypothetical protein [Clostridia bacterium]
MQSKLQNTGEDAYFAASNSRDGFRSYYEHCFRGRVDRLFCIKGGPGTGKSTLMRAVAREGERYGYRADYYYCSSDPTSLDAVLLYGEHDSVGLIDATAPHVFEPQLPGIAEEVIDLGQFWDAARLETHRGDVERWNAQKARAYRVAYRHLAGVGEVSDNLRDIIAPCVDEKRLGRLALRLLRGTREGQGTRRVALCDSVGLSGCVRLDTYLRRSERLCLIEDYHDSAYLLTERLSAEAVSRGLDVRVSYHPVLPDRIDALMLTADRTAFVVCSHGEVEHLSHAFPHARIVSMKRMTVSERVRAVREQLRRTTHLRDALLEEACLQLDCAARAHFELENIYTAAMDFAAKEQFTQALCRRLFGE